MNILVISGARKQKNKKGTKEDKPKKNEKYAIGKKNQPIQILMLFSPLTWDEDNFFFFCENFENHFVVSIHYAFYN